MKKLVVIEGLDKVGKTTLVEKLKNSELSAKFFNFPSSEYPYLRALTKDFENTSHYIRDLCHAVTHGLTYVEIEKIKDSVDYVICDRYWYSSLVYSDPTRMEFVENLWMEPKPPIPDLIVYMYSGQDYPSFATSRDDKDPNDSMTGEQRRSIHENYIKTFLRLSEENENLIFLSICVDNRTPEEIFDVILRNIIE